MEIISQLIGMPEVPNVFEHITPFFIARDETGLCPVVHKERIFDSVQVIPILNDLNLRVRVPACVSYRRHEELAQRRYRVKRKIAPVHHYNPIFREAIY